VIIAAAILALFTLYVIRYHWLSWQLERYSVTASWWVVSTKQGTVVADELTTLWPATLIMADLLHWNLRHFVVNQHLYDEMQEWIAGEMERTDLTWETLVRACRKHDDAVTPPGAKTESAEAVEPPADPSRN
jgi:hypothetical protein